MPKAVILVALFGLAALLRIHNAWVAFPLSGFDGPYHGAYIGAIYWDGRLQLPHWFTNHPPLYYALSAGIWKVLPSSVSAHGALFAMRLLNVAAGLALGAAVWASARRLFPERPTIGWFALAICLFLPMHVGAASLLGNQMMASALGAITVTLLLRCLDDPRPRNALLAGAVAGLGVLTKLSVLLVVAVGGLALLVRGWQLYGMRARALTLGALLGLSTLVVSSPYFIHNVATRGAPIDLNVDIWAGVDRSQGHHGRTWDAYIDLHPGSVQQPGTFDLQAQRAVWPVTFSSTWFDAFGTIVDVHHHNAQRMAHILFAFGGLFTLAALAGGGGAATRRIESALPLGLPMLGLLVVLNLASYIAFTREVATLSALKGTYLSPATTSFALFTALGLELVAEHGRLARRLVAVLLASFAACVVLIFWQGGLVPMRVNPADFYLHSYSDPPTLRAFRYFNGREPSIEWSPQDGP